MLLVWGSRDFWANGFHVKLWASGFTGQGWSGEAEEVCVTLQVFAILLLALMMYASSMTFHIRTHTNVPPTHLPKQTDRQEAHDHLTMHAYVCMQA